jgi:Ion transport protein
MNYIISWLSIPLIRVNGTFRTRWDILIIILSLWVCFVLPVHIAFEPDGLDSDINFYFNNLIDIAFVVDIVLNFRTTINNPLTGEEILNSKVIAMSYLKSRFVLDLIATIPYDLMIGNTGGSKFQFQFRVFSILKMVRLVRFTKIIAFLNTTESVKLSLKLFKLIFYLLVYIHL